MERTTKCSKGSAMAADVIELGCAASVPANSVCENPICGVWIDGRRLNHDDDCIPIGWRNEAVEVGDWVVVGKVDRLKVHALLGQADPHEHGSVFAKGVEAPNCQRPQDGKVGVEMAGSVGLVQWHVGNLSCAVGSGSDVRRRHAVARRDT